MAIQYGSKNVDDRYSPLVEPNLFDNNVFQPNQTFTDKYTIGPAGQIFVHKLGKVTVTATTPGNDFTNTDTADTLINIPLDKAYQRSEKIYNAVASAVEYSVGAEHMEQAVRDIREAWNKDIAAEIEVAVRNKVGAGKNSKTEEASEEKSASKDKKSKASA